MARTQFRQFRPKLLSLAVASCFVTGAALANPTNPQVVHGAATIANPAANVLNITTATPRTIINWGSFSINANELTRFLQPSASSAVLNRVVGGDPSAILGALSSNGRVLLVNPSGIMFGAGAQIDVAGLVATSLNLSNADFLANRLKFTDVAGAGSVVNNGNITTPQGGNVYLVGPAVTNNGIITSPKGEVVLAAGNSVELVNPGTPNLRVEITAAENEAKNLGSIIVDSGRAGIYAGLINNSGTIRADSVVNEGGKIMLKATKSVTLEDSSVLSAQGNGGGRIDVLAGDSVRVAGTLDVSAPNGGDGGFVETSAAHVKIDPLARVTATAPFGETGTWLIDPNDFTIASSGGDMTGAFLSCQLGDGSTGCPSGPGGMNMIIASADGVTNGNGDIFVNDQVTWSSNNNLTLNAHRNVQFSSVFITNTGAGSLIANAGTGVAGDVILSGTTIDVGGTVAFNATNDIKLSFATVDAGSNITFGAGQDIILTSSRVWAGAGSVSGTRDLIFTAGRNIELKVSDGESSVESTSTTGDNANLTFTAGSAISITGSNVYASVNDDGEGGGSGGNARVTLNTGTKVTIDGSKVEASGGIHTGGGDGGTATVTIVGPTGIDIINSSTVAAYAGNGDTDFRNSSSARVELCGAMGEGCESGGGGKITVSNSMVYAKGGDGAEGSLGMVSLLAGSGGIGIIGSKSGNGLLAYGGYANGGLPDVAVGGEGLITLQAAGGSITVDGSDVRAYGGAAGVASGDGGNAAVTIFGTNADITGGSLIKAQGGASAVGAGFGGDGAIEFGVAGMTVGGSELRATAGTGVTQSGSSSIALNAALVDIASGSNVNSNAATNSASVQIDSVGSIKLGGLVSTSGSGGGGITLDTGDQIVGAGGTLYNSGSSHTVSLTAVNGIGDAATSTPVRIGNGNFGAVTAKNTGPTGDIALSFAGFSPVEINSTANILNSSPAGTYLIQAEGAEGGFINLNTAFQPGGANPGAGQTVHLKAAHDVTLTGGGTGSIAGAGQVTLEANNWVRLASGTSINAGNVLLQSSDMDIQGTVTADNNVFVEQHSLNLSRPIDLGGLATQGSALSLSGAELSNLSAPGLFIGASSGGTPLGGPITITAPIGPFNSPFAPRLHGSSITQSPLAAITNPAGVVAFATGDITLNEPTNNFGTFEGGSTGGNITVVNGGSLGVGGVMASAGNSISITSSGDLTTTNDKDISGGTVALKTTGSGSKILLADHDISALATGLPDNAYALTVETTLSLGGDVTSAANLNAASGRIALTGNNVTQVGGTIIGRVDATANNNVALSQLGTHTLGTLSAGGTISVTTTVADVLVDSATSISSGNGTTLTGKNVTQNGGTISGPINATASGGNITLTQTGGYSLGLLTASSGGAVSVISTGGSIFDGNGGTANVAASSAVLGAAGGVGSLADPIETQVGQLTLGLSGGEIGVANTGALVVNGVTYAGPSGAAISATGPLTLSGASSSSGAGVLSFSNSTGDLIISSGATVSAGGSASLTSAGNISIGGNVTTTGSAAGTGIELNAGNAIVSSGGILQVGEGQGIGLTAVNGIGALGNPVRLANDSGGLMATNTGSSGNIVLSQISGNPGVAAGDSAKISNANATGIYDLTAETGNWLIEAPLSSLVQVGTQQTLTLRASNGGITATSGLIDAAGTVHLIAANGITANTSVGALSAHNTGAGNIAITDTGVGTLGLVANVASGVNESLRADGGNVTLSTPKTVSIGAPVLASGTVEIHAGSIVDNQTVFADITATGASLSAAVGIGTIANPLETQVGHIVLSSAGGEIGVINAGDLQLNGLNSVGSAMVGSTGLLSTGGASTVTSGNLGLSANNGMLITHDVSVSGNLDLHSGVGDLGIAGASVIGTDITLMGNNILIGFTTSTSPTTVAATNLLKATSAANLNVLGGANASAHSLLEGMDVDLTVGTVGGFLNIHGGSATARIHSVSPSTINVTFPNLDTGGYFVNGIEGVVSSGGSGFFADGLPAVLGQNLVVTYGQQLPPLPPDLPVEVDTVSGVEQAINQVIVATNNQQGDLIGGDPTSNEGGVTDPKEEKDKKSLPICGK